MQRAMGVMHPGGHIDEVIAPNHINLQVGEEISRLLRAAGDLLQLVWCPLWKEAGRRSASSGGIQLFPQSALPIISTFICSRVAKAEFTSFLSVLLLIPLLRACLISAMLLLSSISRAFMSLTIIAA